MSKIKPSLAKGTRDFLPLQKARRNFIIHQITEVYRKFGFGEIETPAMENMETLTGKYGEEGDKLLFRILNSGDFLAKADGDALANRDSKAISRSISEKGLHYDLTVPLARFVAMHRNDIVFPFRRYQVQPVWRADRPQKGRYREFYQCDADVLGSASLWNEVDLIKIFAEAFERLNIQVSIKLNNRKILSGIAEQFNCLDRLTDFTITLDKQDKIGAERVKAELTDKGFPAEMMQILDAIIWNEATDNAAVMQLLKDNLTSETALKGIEELEFLLSKLDLSNLELEPSLARGLDYYTGTIFEVVTSEVKMGTIASGGRYDNLTEVFGLNDVTGVGISFGIDRIYDVLNELNRFPDASGQSYDFLFVNFDEAGADYAQGILSKLREAGFNAELYPDAAKLKKQFKYADDKKFRFALIAGSEEIESNSMTVKNMQSGEQQLLPLSELDRFIADLK